MSDYLTCNLILRQVVLPPMNKITVKKFVKAYSTQHEAAAALGVSRQSLWEWETRHGHIPEPWAYKAKDLLEAKET